MRTARGGRPPHAVPTVKLRLAVQRHLFVWLVTGRLPRSSPALSAHRQSLVAIKEKFLHCPALPRRATLECRSRIALQRKQILSRKPVVVVGNGRYHTQDSTKPEQGWGRMLGLSKPELAHHSAWHSAPRYQPRNVISSRAELTACLSAEDRPSELPIASSSRLV